VLYRVATLAGLLALAFVSGAGYDDEIAARRRIGRASEKASYKFESLSLRRRVSLTGAGRQISTGGGYGQSEPDDRGKRRERRIPRFDHAPNARPDVRYCVFEHKPPGAG